MANINEVEVSPKSPLKRLVTLSVLIVALLGTLVYGSITSEEKLFTPNLALDLEGGTQLILTPVSTDGSVLSDEDINQAIEVIRQRVDASGVAEAEITAQGGQNIVVSLPGEPNQETLDLVRTSAVLRLRPVLGIMAPGAINSQGLAQLQAAQVNTENAGTNSESGATAGTETEVNTETAEDATVDNSATTDTNVENAESNASSSDNNSTATTDVKELSAEEIRTQLTTLLDKNGNGTLDEQPATTPANTSDQNWVTEKLLYDAYTLACGTKEAQIQGTQDDPNKASVACALDDSVKYLLGPAEIQGTNLKQASSHLAVDRNGTPTGGWAVSMVFDSAGGAKFAEITGRIYQLSSPLNQFAIVLDGKVLSAPVPSGPISGGQAEITGNFQAADAATLANQLSFGSLPLNFEVQSEEQISATLGTEQLTAGLWAGLIGLVVIVLYMVWQYHGLGVLAVASIILSTGLSYFIICLLSWTMGYRLSMAGVLGMIISIGVTADSFIVYFERIRDEIRDGRNVVGAIKHGWDRAKRTIIISDFVNMLASVVLYFLTVGSVRGFAFTLGVTTVLDLIVVMMFTYPIMYALGKTKLFGEGRPYSGLNEAKLRNVPFYRGRGATSLDTVLVSNKPGKENLDTENAVATQDGSELVSGEKKMSLAQRRAAERRAQKEQKATEVEEGGIA